MTVYVLLRLMVGLVVVAYAPGAYRDWRGSVSARDAAEMDRHRAAMNALEDRR